MNTHTQFSILLSPNDDATIILSQYIVSMYMYMCEVKFTTTFSVLQITIESVVEVFIKAKRLMKYMSLSLKG